MAQKGSKSENRKSYKMKGINLFKQNPKQNCGSPTNLKNSPKGPKRFKMIPKTKNSEIQKTKR